MGISFVRAGLLLALFNIVISVPAQSDDLIAKGAALFRQYCVACHEIPALNTNSVGPSLYHIVGQKAASVDGFVYSEALKQSGLVWTESRLDGYLTNPKGYIGPDRYTSHYISMQFGGISLPFERKAIIAYLKDN